MRESLGSVEPVCWDHLHPALLLVAPPSAHCPGEMGESQLRMVSEVPDN